MKTALHRIALRFGWYKDITTGLPLNVCKTVFGVYFLEGVYTPDPIGKLVMDMYRWGCHDGLTSVIPLDGPCLPDFLDPFAMKQLN